ncbi:3-oxoacyl-[acyl-carrier-protein] synthase III C-terminal domain-containing protein [Streptomyces sp. ISL-99]|uniref:3-oxoacyl-ACP synthase III family protein n=1 Tax=Streptomyces sp. ISL-99 TaxID=2819193 RepID=UPI0027E57F54|nr:3-oxoacyl-[acyl-carrier-protein] synthase III C-terminal domain-containing protein [Streptomyces sp. ISL-99]
MVNFMPERVVRNSEAQAENSDLSDHAFFAGVHERRFAWPGYTSAQLGTAALKKLFERNSVRAADVDLIICASQLNDAFSPGVGTAIQHAVGATSAAVLQVDNGCCSWISSVNTAKAFIDSGHYRTIAVVTVTNFVSRLDEFQKSPESRVLGDGASATLLTVGEEPTILSIHEQAFGENWGALRVEPNSVDGMQIPYWADGSGALTVKFDQNMLARLYAVTMEQLPRAVDVALEKAGVDNKDVAYLITHQPNDKYVAEWRKRCGFDDSRAHDTLSKYGNMFQGSLPVTFADALDKRMVSPGDLIAFATFSHGGELVASMVWRWN